MGKPRPEGRPSMPARSTGNEEEEEERKKERKGEERREIRTEQINQF